MPDEANAKVDCSLHSFGERVSFGYYGNGSLKAVSPARLFVTLFMPSEESPFQFAGRVVAPIIRDKKRKNLTIYN